MGGDPLYGGPGVVTCGGERVLRREPVVDGGGGNDGDEVIHNCE